MRWNEHVAGVGDEAAASLLNDLTLGSGRISFAVRLLSANAETQAVLDSVAGAYRALRRARAVLAGEAAQPVEREGLDPAPARLRRCRGRTAWVCSTALRVSGC